MTSLVHRTSMFLILIVCGPALQLTSAAPGPSCELVDRLSIYNGKYVGEVDGIKVEITNRPVDIPALNQNYPFYGTELHDGVQMYEGIALLDSSDDINHSAEFYPFKNLSMYRASESDFSAITRDDLAEPTCTANSSKTGGVVRGRMHCFEFGYDFIFEMDLACTYQSIRSAPGLPSPEAFESLPSPVYYTRIVQYPLPEVWLDGEVCESSCCA